MFLNRSCSYLSLPDEQATQTRRRCDTVRAFNEVKTLCRDRGIKAVSGIEISAYDRDVKVHTLGYNFNAENPDFKRFLNGLTVICRFILSMSRINGFYAA